MMNQMATTYFRTERPTCIPEQPVKTQAERFVQSVVFLAGTSKLVCEQLVNMSVNV